MVNKYFLFIVLLFLSNPLFAEITDLHLQIGNKEPITSPIDSYDPNINSYPDPFNIDWFFRDTTSLTHGLLKASCSRAASTFCRSAGLGY